MGINLANQDAVATARILTPPLNAHSAHFRTGVLAALLESETATPPAVLKITNSFPPVRHAIGRMISIGIRPEHLTT